MASNDNILIMLNASIDRINGSQMSESNKIKKIIHLLGKIIDRIEALDETLDRDISNYEDQLKNSKIGLELLKNTHLSTDANRLKFWNDRINEYNYKISVLKNTKRELPYLKNRYEQELFKKLDRKKILDKEQMEKWAAEYENRKFERYVDYAWRFGRACIGLIVSGTVMIITSPIWIPFALFLLSKSFYDDKSFKNTLESLFEPELPPPLAKEQNQKSTSEHFSSPLLSVISKDNQQNIPTESVNVPLMQSI